MAGFKDISGLTRAAVVALLAYMVFDPLAALLHLAYPTAAAGDSSPYPGDQAGTPADLAALPQSLALIACLILIACWIYRANANAHALSADMTIRPGWAVGWFFVPFANLVMPFQAMKETWRESHEAAGLYEERETSLVAWWWGLWIATNILANLSFMLGGRTAQALEAAIYVDLIHAALNVPLCLVLVRLMRRLDATQRFASHAAAFA